MEKRNVMKSGVLWNEVVTADPQDGYEDVTLEHMLADAGGMQLVRWPKQFDVIVTDNLFGDMLSDVAAMLTGSLGMLPSASLGCNRMATGKRKALYEPVHGSAPDIAGTGLANPIAMIASFGMALRYSFEEVEAADLLDKAIANALDKGLRTKDIAAGRRSDSCRLPKWAMPSSPNWTLSDRLSSNRRLHQRAVTGYPGGGFSFKPTCGPRYDRRQNRSVSRHLDPRFTDASEFEQGDPPKSATLKIEDNFGMARSSP
jgi:hypothetical protein